MHRSQARKEDKKKETTENASRKATHPSDHQHARQRRRATIMRWLEISARCVIRGEKTQPNHKTEWGSNWSVHRHRYRRATTPVVPVSTEVHIETEVRRLPENSRRTSTQRPARTCTSAIYPWGKHGQQVRNRSLQRQVNSNVAQTLAKKWQGQLNCLLLGPPEDDKKRSRTCHHTTVKTTGL